MHPESGRYRVCHKGVSHTAPYLPGESTGVIKKFSSLEYDILNLYLHDLQMLKKKIRRKFKSFTGLHVYKYFCSHIFQILH